ncbi:hypothetical protein Pryu01_02238 [Paraliobacillus ryukyuensis]|uniref:Uncharacterized protein n=1 Tax=Paraliobacillus ryukyuensis TaxID=200904 RepID=A0A366E968_9BACI|nr:hypothetical protein [Paraliobacillus ryukyuensis]RBO98014.1 hypothetical protein DES48_10634 [Paraliobacillus ryukyuensis]
MYLNAIDNLQLYSQLSLTRVEDRMLIKADFPQKFIEENNLVDPFLYVTIYARGGERVRVIDEGTTKIYHLTEATTSPLTYHQILTFAIEHSKQFQHLTS